ncbi:MAG: non-homologous end-joining DNA ligase [Burkholderiales bacterium]
MAKDALKEYASRRSFTATPEPPARVRPRTGGPLLFVVQQHAAQRMHWDFRLECDGVLLSWAVPKGPSLDRNDKRLAAPTEDHPYDYASFEGVIPAGQYGAGEVIVWDCGVYSPDEGGVTWYRDSEGAQREVREGLAAGKLSIELRGEKLKGSFALVRTKEAWLLIKHKDRFVSTADVTRQDRSVLSGLRVGEVKFVKPSRVPADRLAPAGDVAPMPKSLLPMLADSADAPFHREGWSWEPKLDGYRVMAFVDKDGARLRSRRGLDLTPQFPRLAAELAAQDADMILDGELVAFDAEGRPSFNALQDRAGRKTPTDIAAGERSIPVAMVCFDLLHFAGIDLVRRPYGERRRYLAQCLLPSPLVQRMHVADDGVALHAAAAAAGFEGVVGKRNDSLYEPGRRTSAWLKVKPVRTGEFVVGGYTRGKGARAPLGALIVGYHADGALHYASHVGSGFDDRTLAGLTRRLAGMKIEACPFAKLPDENGPPVWVEPSLVAEVSYHSITPDGRLRAPVFVRMRDDVPASSVQRPGIAGTDTHSGIEDIVGQLARAKATCTLEVGEHRIKLTNLDRVYWPEDMAQGLPAYTKRDLIEYLAKISPHMLPHLADRPLTMIRMPEGIAGERFFQKHWEQARPGFVESITVYSGSKDESHDYLLCNNLPTLLWLAQSGTLEYHVWHSRAKLGPDAATTGTDYATSLASLEASILNYPDYVLFDLDPYIYSGKEAKGAEPELNLAAFEKGKEVAFWLRELLATMSLEAIVKTSGKTGLHVFVPIERTIDFDAARHVSELVGAHLMKLHPKDITQEWSIPKRTGKIFMDYNMNVRGKTLNVAYSPRGVAGAPVSMPLTWEELAGAHPLDFTMGNAPQRLARTGDLWANALTRKQNIQQTLGLGAR